MNQKCMSVPGYKDKCDIMQINAQETNIKSINIKLNHEFEILFVQLRINFQVLWLPSWLYTNKIAEKRNLIEYDGKINWIIFRSIFSSIHN